MSDLPLKPLTKPVPESARWDENAQLHIGPERAASGNLPDQPEGLEVDALAGNPTPYKNLTTGR